MSLNRVKLVNMRDKIHEAVAIAIAFITERDMLI